jgi:hypothetical protein
VLKAIAIKAPDMGNSIALESGVYVVQPQVAAPIILPLDSQGPFKDSVQVSIVCQTPGAETWYTTDGSNVHAIAASTELYSGPFVLSKLSPGKNEVKALSSKRHMAVSQQVDASFVIKPAACVPRFDVQEGLYVEGMSVTITCEVHHHGIPGSIYYVILPSDADEEEPDETSQLYTGAIVMDVVGNQTIKAIAMGPHVLASPVIQSPFYAILPDPACAVDEYEPHTGQGEQEIEFDLFERNCLPCPLGGTSPKHSKGVFACTASRGYVGADGGPFHVCPLNRYKDFDGDGTCTACPPLGGTEQTGASDVTNCRALVGAHGVDGGPFSVCPTDSYSASMGNVECPLCPEGSSTRGMEGVKLFKDCVAMPGYTNVNNWEEGPFEKCKIGQYKTEFGPLPCKACPFCSTTQEEGSQHMTDCLADIGCEGKGFGWGLGFTKCKFGSFKPNVGNGMCPPCDASSDAISCGSLYER